jgi:hypothetical protein
VLRQAFSSLLVLDSLQSPRHGEFVAIKKWLLYMANLELELEGEEEITADIPIHFVQVFALPPNLTFSCCFLT